MKPLASKQNSANIAKNIRVGQIGEDIATKFLLNKGFSILERNYRRRWAEIDIVARGTDGQVHFVEVKTVSHGTKASLERSITDACVPGGETWRPEEMVHDRKLKQIHKGVELWLVENNYQGRFQIDVIAIRLAEIDKQASVRYLENVI